MHSLRPPDKHLYACLLSKQPISILSYISYLISLQIPSCQSAMRISRILQQNPILHQFLNKQSSPGRMPRGKSKRKKEESFCSLPVGGEFIYPKEKNSAGSMG